jgi:predicted ATPase
MAETIEVLTAERPLLLVLEALHWNDYAILDLVTSLAQRRDMARFLLLGTDRSEAPVDGQQMSAHTPTHT